MTRYEIALGKRIKLGRKKFVKKAPSIHCSICLVDALCNDYCNRVFGFCPAFKHAYQPRTIDEATSYLYAWYRSMPSDVAYKIFATSEQEFILQQHAYLGEGLRHLWGLENDSYMAQYFKSREVYSADDMVVILLVSLHRRIKGKRRDLPTLIREYGNFWQHESNPHEQI